MHIAAALDRKPIVKRLLQWAADPSLINNVSRSDRTKTIGSKLEYVPT